MRRLKYWIRDFFGFSRSQVNGFIVLLTLIILILFSEPAWHWYISGQVRDVTRDRYLLDSLVAVWESDKGAEISAPGVQEPLLFRFDPNNTPEELLISLGFSRQEATRIIRYREKGGKFKTKSDLLKIYGLDSALYQRVHAFIALPEKLPERAPPSYVEKPVEKPTPKAEKPLEKFDLNVADTAQLKKIYGIGEKLSLRIVKYREVLGGFINKDQLKEVYGLDSTVIRRLVENSIIKEDYRPIKININKASEKQLSRHPYLSKVAGALVAYRFQHGDFETVEEIRHVTALDEQVVERIMPYLKLNDEP